MKHSYAYLLLLAASLIVAGCNRGIPLSTQYVLDGVKLLEEGRSGTDPTTFSQSTYALTSSSRLLLRYEALLDKVHSVDTSNGKTVQIILNLGSATEADQATTALTLCPLTRNWMLYATWLLAHPFAGGQTWNNPGGDYESDLCVSPEVDTDNQINFDVTEWFVNYPRGRSQNFGHILISTASLTIIGDTSPTEAPQILFDEF